MAGVPALTVCGPTEPILSMGWMNTNSEFVLLALFPSPPPETVSHTLPVAGAFLAKSTVTLIGKLPKGIRASERVQVRLLSVQLHPEPLIAEAVRPVERVVTAVIVPLEETFPLLSMKMV